MRKGFTVQTMPTSNPILVAHQKGNWWRKSKQLIIEIISLENNLTRIDITAILNTNTENRHAEEVIEGNFASAFKKKLNKVNRLMHGI